MTPPTLFQFHYSPQCEKVRWALDYKAIPHFRRNLIPGPHAPRVLALTRQTKVPVMDIDGEYLWNTNRILPALEEHRTEPTLYPHEPSAQRQIDEWTNKLDDSLGVLATGWFDLLLENPDYVRAMWTVGQPTSKRRTFRMLFSSVVALMKRQYGLTSDSGEQSRRAIVAGLDRIDNERAGANYLVDNRFSAADLCAASLLSWLVSPRHTPYRLQHSLPEAAAAWRDELSEHPTMIWIENLYETHRGISMSENRETDGSAVI